MTKHIHIHLSSRAKDANPDGTIGPDEERRRKEVVEKARKLKEDLKKEAYSIGGNFRGPGIWAEIQRVLKS